MEYLFSFLVIIFTTAGQIFLKKATFFNYKTKVFSLIFIGYFLFILAFVFSYVLMKLIPMKYYVVIMSINYITVLFGAKYFLNEKINKNKIIGTSLVTIGIIIFLYKG